jgi:hypothetical protein
MVSSILLDRLLRRRSDLSQYNASAGARIVPQYIDHCQRFVQHFGERS